MPSASIASGDSRRPAVSTRVSLDAVQAQLLAQQVARGAGDGADDRAFVRGQRIEQGRFADIRRADDHRVQAVDQRRPRAAAARARRQRAAHRPAAPAAPASPSASMSSSGKSKPASTWMRSTVSASTSASHAARELAVERAARRRARRLAAGADQVGDRFGLRQVELALRGRRAR
jgi:hypothetical protein